MTNPPETVTWPSTAVRWESVEWKRDPARDAMMSRRARLAARGTYRAAIPAQIARLPLTLPPEVSAAAEDAVLAISRFDAAATAAMSAPGRGSGASARVEQEPQELGPLSTILLRTESASSSQIEDITAGAQALALASMGERAGPNAAKVAANVEAMLAAGRMASDLAPESVLAAHAALMHDQPHASPGRWRESAVWIGGHAPTAHTATFVPPQPSRIHDAIADLMAFCARTDLPVLVHAALAHAQFETIHPFADDNGHTGRVLVHGLLRHAGAAQRLTIPVSAGLLIDTESYFQALTAYRAGDCAPIVERFTQASFEAVALGDQLLSRLTEIRSQWSDDVTARRDSVVWRILPQLIAQPAVTVAWVGVRGAVSQPAAQRASDQMVQAGVLTPVNSHRRNRAWIAAEITQAMDDVMSAALRRT